jgi:hypothetical protein
VPPHPFAALVLSLSASAMLQLGLESTPDAPKAVVDLPLAKQTIDILEMLREKTRGNLDESEDSLLENVLHELRMKYVELSRG